MDKDLQQMCASLLNHPAQLTSSSASLLYLSYGTEAASAKNPMAAAVPLLSSSSGGFSWAGKAPHIGGGCFEGSPHILLTLKQPE